MQLINVSTVREQAGHVLQAVLSGAYSRSQAGPGGESPVTGCGRFSYAFYNTEPHRGAGSRSAQTNTISNRRLGKYVPPGPAQRASSRLTFESRSTVVCQPGAQHGSDGRSALQSCTLLAVHHQRTPRCETRPIACARVLSLSATAHQRPPISDRRGHQWPSGSSLGIVSRRRGVTASDTCQSGSRMRRPPGLLTAPPLPAGGLPPPPPPPLPPLLLPLPPAPLIATAAGCGWRPGESSLSLVLGRLVVELQEVHEGAMHAPDSED